MSLPEMTLDRTGGQAPLVITAMLTPADLTDWRWLLNGDLVQVGGLLCTFRLADAREPYHALRVEGQRPDGPYWDEAHLVIAPAPVATASLTLDRTTIQAGETVTATLTQTGLLTWRWLLDGAIHPPHDGLTHAYTLTEPGLHAIGLRTHPAAAVSALPIMVQETVQPPAFYRLQTGGCVDEPSAAALRDTGWQGIRVETPAEWRQALRTATGAALESTRQLVVERYRAVREQCAEYGWTPLHLIEREEVDLIPLRSEVEYLNEPDLGSWRRLTADQYRDELLAVVPTLLDRGCTVYVGSVANMGSDNLAYLRQALRGMPPEVRACWHRYPLKDDQDRTKPRQGFSSRHAELAAFKGAIGARRFAVTEFGFQGAPARYRNWAGWKYFGKLVSRSDAWVAETIRQEFEFWRQAGADFAVLYRLQAGHGGFGVQREDGAWKPAARVPLMGGR